MKKKPKQKTKGYYVKKLDIVFSQYIRKSYANDFGMAECYTCNKVLQYKDLQNGHFISRGHMNTRWDEMNNHAQCIGCNVFNHGKMDEYALFMVKKYGEGILEEMKKRKDTLRQWTIKEMEEQIKIYKEKVNSIING